MLNLLINAFMVAMAASCWHYVLIRANHIAHPVAVWLNTRYVRRMRTRPNAWRTKAANWLQRSILLCSYCLAGQIALVTFLVVYGNFEGLRWYELFRGLSGEQWATAPIFTASAIYLETFTGKWLKNQAQPPPRPAPPPQPGRTS